MFIKNHIIAIILAGESYEYPNPATPLFPVIKSFQVIGLPYFHLNSP